MTCNDRDARHDSLYIERRRGDWMQTASGGIFWPLDPDPDEVQIGDIAHALSQICRFGGHSLRFYSVAEHSVRVARYRPKAPRAHRLAALLHDASEAYLGDIIRPIKIQKTAAMDEFRRCERRVQNAIWSALLGGYPTPAMTRLIKTADLVLLATERRDLMAAPPAPWAGLPEPLPGRIEPWTPIEAARAFLMEYADLTNGGRR